MTPSHLPEQRASVLNVPNTITVARLVLLTPLVIYLMSSPDTRVLATVAVAVFSGTDWIDGFLARRLNQVTEFGRVFDPVADRFGIGLICIAMLVFGILPWWVPAVIVLVDAAILFVGIGRRSRVRHMRVLPLGKARTALIMVGLPLATLGASDLAAAPTIRVVALVVLGVGIAAHAVVGVRYLYELLRPRPVGELERDGDTTATRPAEAGAESIGDRRSRNGGDDGP
ncbi:CDP-alcohol phosphatidyltransferase family protein [Propionibacteriaceae bacterium Y2011]